MDKFMQLAIDEARKGLAEGGIPIGSILVRGNRVLGMGHNKRVQNDDPIMHAEIDCLHNAGRVGYYGDTILYSTLMPCYLCAGAVVQFGITQVVVGESETFAGARAFMEEHRVTITDLSLPECKQLMTAFIEHHPTLWKEDIGELIAFD